LSISRFARAILLIFFCGVVAAQSVPTKVSAAAPTHDQMPFEDPDSEKPCENEESVAKTECHAAAAQNVPLLQRCQHVQHLHDFASADVFGRNLVNAIHRLRI
jgi:hypothetical protein